MRRWRHGRCQRSLNSQRPQNRVADSSYVSQFERVLQGFRLKTGQQHYSLDSQDAGLAVNGTNVYGILRAPRGDATEAIVLFTCWRTVDGRIDVGGVSLLMSLAGYFNRPSFSPNPSDSCKAGRYGPKTSSSSSLPSPSPELPSGSKPTIPVTPASPPPSPSKAAKFKPQYKFRIQTVHNSILFLSPMRVRMDNSPIST